MYFLPLIGGIIADKIGYGKCVTIGIIIMFLGYVLLAIPMGGIEYGSTAVAMSGMIGALVLISFGTGLFKGNLQVMVGNLYDDPKYSDRRDAAFSLFYMAINIGAMFAPTAAVKIMAWAQESLGVSVNDSYHFAFAVACASLILSIAIYYACRPWFKHVENTAKQAAASGQKVDELSPEQTKKRIVALCLVFAVVIFFWMAFHQNGSALTFFADKYTKLNGITGVNRMWFNIWSLALIAVSIYTLFAIFQSDTKKARIIAGVATLALWAGAIAFYLNMPDPFNAATSDFQQFNPFFVVALTPVSVAVFGALGNKGKEPSAPVKIGLGMLLAGVGFAVITAASTDLISPKDLGDSAQSVLSPNWLIGTYFTLTVAELLLSPMGISFVSKVAPPRYKGLMMGGWFAATAIGNYLSRIPSALWKKIPLMANWAILIALCVIAGLIMFVLRKKLEAATQD